MKVYIEEPGKQGKQTSVVLVLDIREARTLQECVQAGHEAQKRRSSFRRLRKLLDERLCVW